MKTNGLQNIEKSSRSHLFLIYAALVFVTAAAFEPVRKNDFIRLYDDGKYVTDNQAIKGGLNLESIRWAVSTPHYFMWHPLTSLSYVLEYQLFGLNPFWYHLTNLLLHTASVILLFWVLKRMTGALWPSAFVAAVFAFHPLQVESVAWIAERKSVLSGFFWLLTIAAYVRYVQLTSVGRYIIVLIVFCLSAMTKPTVVTLPFALLLLDYWPLRRFGWLYKRSEKDFYEQIAVAQSSVHRLIIEKIPLFIISILLSVITYLSQQSGNVINSEERFPLDIRIANAFVSYIRYIGKLIYPTGLAVFYPHPGRNLPNWQPAISFLLLVIISILVVWQIRRRPYLAVGWFWYLGILVPVIGLVQAGGQAMADRYTYIPLIGIYMMIAWIGGEVLERWRSLRIYAALLAGLIFCALLVATRTQVGYWQNDETLFSHAVKVTKNNHLAHYNLAKSFESKGQYDKAIENYKQVVQITPSDYETYNNMGAAFLTQGQFDQAVVSYSQSLKIKPDYAIAIYNLGLAKLKQGKYAEAVAQFTRALVITPNSPEAYNELGNAYTGLGKYDLAIKNYEKAIKLKPDYITAIYNAGMATLKQNKYDKTIEYFRKALEQNPDSVIVLNSLAWILATAEDSRFQNPTDAVKYAEKACKLINYNDAAYLDTLAAACASAGIFDQAVQTAEKAFKLAEVNEQEKLANEIQEHLKVYKAKQPWLEHTHGP
jgi:tetratricopeptide (TPR) repeat protein